MTLFFIKKLNIVRSYCLRRYKDGFYVHGPANKKSKSYVKSSKETADYISRYASHPPISESNILSLDEDGHTITWSIKTAIRVINHTRECIYRYQ